MSIEVDLSTSQQRWLNILPRICAGISLVFSWSLVVGVAKSQYHRTRIYHRIMAACAANIIILNLNQLWGSAAMPSETEFLGAVGNTATCSAQGFLSQFLWVVPSYYVALSLLSYFSVRHKFQVKKYEYIEKWIHCGVYLFPLGSSSYLLKQNAYNPAITGCILASEPLGCGDQSNHEIECTRGPQNIGQLQLIFIALPSILTLAIPTAVMLVLYCQVRKQRGGKRVAASLAKQSGLYLCAQYWTYLFRSVDAVLVFAVGEYVFATNILANSIEALQGLWTLMVYLYFRVDDPDSQSHNEMSISIKVDNNSKSRELSADGKSRDFSVDGSWVNIPKPGFSIFDGTNLADLDSPWAAFLIDEGEDEEYAEDSEYDDQEDFDMNASKFLKPGKLTVQASEATLATTRSSTRASDVSFAAMEIQKIDEMEDPST